MPWSIVRRRSNLLRARRKLQQTLSAGQGPHASGRSLPKQWQKPEIRTRDRYPGETTSYRLSVTSTPPPGSPVAAGETIAPLVLHIAPVPPEGARASFTVVCGSVAKGPYTLPVNGKGCATGFVTVEPECDGHHELVVRWEFHQTMVEARWPLSSPRPGGPVQ